MQQSIDWQNGTVEGFRLSPQQRCLWLLQQTDHSQPYRSQMAVSIEGRFDREILVACLQNLVGRHEILRTCFKSLPELSLAVQSINDIDMLWSFEDDLSGLDEKDQEEYVDRAFRTMTNQSFDFENGPILHLGLIKLSPIKRVLFLSLPALCADAKSLNNLMREIADSYASCLQGRTPDNEVIQYVDAAEVFNELIEDDDMESGREYWRKRILFDSPARPLPFEEQPPEWPKFEPAVHPVTITPSQISEIGTFINDYEVTDSAFVLSCWQLLLYRLTGQSDIIVGMAFDGRKYDGLEDALGLFSRHLPIKADVQGDQPFARLLNQVSDALREAEAWQEYFSWESIDGERSLPGYFDFCFERQRPAPEFVSCGLRFSLYRQYNCSERYKVKLRLIEQAESLGLELHYDAQYYGREDIERLSEELVTLIGSAVRGPQRRIDQLEIVGEKELMKQLREYNCSEAEYGEAECLHELVERQARRSPEAVAVVSGQDQLSYRELNEKANRLGRYLQSKGVCREEMVGISLERGLEMVIGILGILKAGGAYLPIDPGDPGQRRDRIVKESGVRVVVTEGAIGESYEGKVEEVIRVDEQCGEIGRERGGDLGRQAEADNLAYVIHTSGTTGQPKGVMVSHRAIYNRLMWSQTTYPLSQDDRVLQIAPFNFDFSIWEIFGPLMAGGSVILAESGSQRDISHLAMFIDEQGVTITHFVPSMLRVFLDLLGQDRCDSLRYVFSGGESLSADLQDRFFTHSDAELYNQYGPSEATIDATYWYCRRNKDQQTVPIGRPISNLRVNLLDRHLMAIPVGMSGELHIGGVGLARGYIGHADLTAEKFIPDQFSQTNGERIYKSGDLARYLSDGNIEYLGRIDEQVKVRGFRVELGEIEAALSRHPAILGSVVVLREIAPCDKRLVAYVVTDQSSNVTTHELSKYLEASLPAYMLPSVFVLLERLPFLPNGKVDRHSLPEPTPLNHNVKSESSVLHTPVEEILAGIWSSVFRVERVDLQDDFFKLGGHSLLATQVASRVRSVFNVKLPLQYVFEATTLADFAIKVQTLLAEQQGQQIPPLSAVSRDQELPMSFAQQRLWLVHQLNPDSPAYNWASGLRLKGRLDVVALEKTLSEVIRRHEILRTTFVVVDGRPLQIINSAKPVTLPITDLTTLPEEHREEQARRLFKQEAQQPFDLEKDSLIRVMLMRLGEHDHAALITIHHIVSDGWSVELLVKEVAVLYEAYSNGKSSPLADLAIQYADYAVWQRQLLQGEALEKSLSYWRRQLADAPTELKLPTKQPQATMQSSRGASRSFSFPPDSFERSVTLCNQEGVTNFMMLFSVLNVLLNYYSQQDDIIVGVPIANRNRSEVEGLIGFFINMLVLRTDLSGNPTFRELIRRVRKVALEAFVHQDLPFEKIVEELDPDRDLSRIPLVRVALNFQIASESSGLELSGLSLSPMDVGFQTALFDLSLDIRIKGKELFGTWAYSPDLFNAITIERMVEDISLLLETVFKSPDSTLHELRDILDKAYRNQRITKGKEYEEANSQMMLNVKRQSVRQALI